MKRSFPIIFFFVLQFGLTTGFLVSSAQPYCVTVSVNENQNSTPLNWSIQQLKLGRLVIPYYSGIAGYSFLDVKDDYEVFQGRSYNLNFNAEVTSSSNVVLPQYYFCKIWVDFNGDGNFEENFTEKIITLFWQVGDPVSIPLNVPANAFTSGEVRMRIAVSETDVMLACDDIQSGTMVDYSMQISPAQLGISADGYCLPIENYASEKMELVGVSPNLILPVGQQTSYEEYDFPALKFTPGTSTTIYLKPVANNQQDDFYWAVSLDLNGDKEFEQGEILYYGHGNALISGLLAIPPDAAPGKTRMRVSLAKDQYHAFSGVGPPYNSCLYVEYGQIRDYLVEIEKVCLPPTELKVSFPQHYSAIFEWPDAVPATDLYDLQFKETNAANWSSWLVQGTSFDAKDLIHAGVAYQARVRSVCPDEYSAFTKVVDFDAPGYCDSKGNDQDDWIQFVELKNINTTSGANGGYADFTSKEQTALAIGENYDITFKAGGVVRSRNWKAWIDFNRDGVFDDWESIMKKSTPDLNTYTVNFTVPDYVAVAEGSTRLRISMAHDNPDIKPCSSGYPGEVEDYRIWLVRVEKESNVAENNESEFKIYPQPATDVLYIEATTRDEITDLKLFDSRGNAMNIRYEKGEVWSMYTRDLVSGIYILHIYTRAGVTTELVFIGS